MPGSEDKESQRVEENKTAGSAELSEFTATNKTGRPDIPELRWIYDEQDKFKIETEVIELREKLDKAMKSGGNKLAREIEIMILCRINAFLELHSKILGVEFAEILTNWECSSLTDLERDSFK